ncbi:MAG: asparagine synthase (glutamine-hydrolyzing) [Pseudomonadota bacterium]
MCGIAGIFDFRSGGKKDETARIAEIERMLGRIAHRGPDEAGWLLAPGLSMGTVRLQVMDLTQGQQPMSDESGRWWIAYNGEVYNFIELRAELQASGYAFKTQCDTEVALKAWIAWGVDAFDRFDGGFAIALFDRLSGALTLARDRYGKRPLYLRHLPGRIGFGSEIKALQAMEGPGLEWDLRGLGGLMAKWCPEGHETPYAGVTQLEAGHALMIDRDGREARHVFGGFTLPQRPGALSPVNALSETRAALRDATRLRLRSDAELGVMLSGGLDSAIVAHLVREQWEGALHTFSVNFTDRQFDEAEAQQEMVSALGSRHSAVEIDKRDIAANFAQALWHAEIPQFRTAFVPFYLMSRHIAARGVKVVLSGEGADEIFLGYDIFRETRLRAQWHALSQEARRAALTRLYPYLPLFSAENTAALEARFAKSVRAPDAPLFSHDIRFQHGRFAQRLLREQTDGTAGLARAVAAQDGAQTPLARAQWIEFQTLLQGYLLSSQGDRMMFAHGIEPRMPFLSRKVVEFAGSLPEEMLLDAGGTEKAILKRAFAGKLPAQILSRPKQPYLAPDAASFFSSKGGLLPWVADALAPSALKRIAPLDPRHAERLVAKISASAPEKVSPRESQAFMLLLSLSLLNETMIGAAGRAPANRALGRRTVERSLVAA